MLLAELPHISAALRRIATISLRYYCTRHVLCRPAFFSTTFRIPSSAVPCCLTSSVPALTSPMPISDVKRFRTGSEAPWAAEDRPPTRKVRIFARCFQLFTSSPPERPFRCGIERDAKCGRRNPIGAVAIFITSSLEASSFSQPLFTRT